MEASKKQTLKKMLNFTFIIGTFLFSIYFAIKSGDVSKIGEALLRMHPLWLLGALLCFVVHCLLEGLISYVFFRFQDIKINIKYSLLVGLIGMYYSSITPAATGGQPMQVYALKKRGVPPGLSSSALAVKFFCWQAAVLMLGGGALDCFS